MVIPGPNYQAHAFLNTQNASYGQLRQQTNLMAQQTQILQQQLIAEQAHHDRLEKEAAIRRDLLRFLHEVNKYTDELLSYEMISIEQYLYFATKHGEFFSLDFSFLDSMETIEFHGSTSDKMKSSAYALRNRIDMNQKMQYYWILAMLEDLAQHEKEVDDRLILIDSYLQPELEKKKSIDNLGYLRRQLKTWKENLPKLNKTRQSGLQYGIIGIIFAGAGVLSILSAAKLGFASVIIALVSFLIGFSFLSTPKNTELRYQSTKSKIISLEQDIKESELSATTVEWKKNHFTNLRDEILGGKEMHHNQTMEEVIRIGDSLNILNYPAIQIQQL